MGMRILIDTNILLDYILCRSPFDSSARRILVACKQDKVAGCIAAHSVSNIFFILRKAYSVDERKSILRNLCELFEVEGIDKAKILDALADDNFSDFEDCLQMQCAMSFRANYIVTRNRNDFVGGSIPCVDPDEFCEML